MALERFLERFFKAAWASLSAGGVQLRPFVREAQKGNGPIGMGLSPLLHSGWACMVRVSKPCSMGPGVGRRAMNRCNPLGAHRAWIVHFNLNPSEFIQKIQLNFGETFTKVIQLIE